MYNQNIYPEDEESFLAPSSIPLPPPAPAETVISLVGVARTFYVQRREVWALRHIDMQIRRGSFVVLIGPTGSGKTTLLNLVAGLDQPSAGSLTVEGQRLDKMSSVALAALRRRMGFILQHTTLMPTASAYENIELGLRLAGGLPRRDWNARIRRCLEAVGLSAWADRCPYEMHAGQQQRVAIARALAIRPRLILADEPTGNLNNKMSTQLLGLLRTLVDTDGVTLLMATQDPSAAIFATDVYRLRDGQMEGPERQ